MMKTGKNNRFLASILAASMLLAMSPFAFAAADTAEQKEMTTQEQVQPATQNETNANPTVSQTEDQSSKDTNSEALKTKGQSSENTNSEASKTEGQPSEDVKPAGDSTSASKTPAESENPTESETPAEPETPKKAAKIGEDEYPTVAAPGSVQLLPAAPVEETGAEENALTAVPAEKLIFDQGVIKGIDATWLAENKDKPLSVAIPAEMGGTPVTSIGQNAFRAKNAGLKNHPRVAAVDFSNATNLEKIDNQAFQYSPVTSVDLSNTKVTTIGKFAFGNCTSLETFIFPDTLTSLGNSNGASVFTDCKSLKVMRLADSPEGVVFELPETLTYIGKNTFKNCFADGVEAKVVIPASVATLGEGAFCDKHITQIIINKKYDAWSGGSLYDSNAIRIPDGTNCMIIFPDKSTYDSFTGYSSTEQNAMTYPVEVKFFINYTWQSEHHLNYRLLGYQKNANTGFWEFDDSYALPEAPASSAEQKPGYDYIGGWSGTDNANKAFTLQNDKPLNVTPRSDGTVKVTSGQGTYVLQNPTISYLVDGKSKPVDADQPFTVTIGDGKEHTLGVQVSHPLLLSEQGNKEGEYVYFEYCWWDEEYFNSTTMTVNGPRSTEEPNLFSTAETDRELHRVWVKDNTIPITKTDHARTDHNYYLVEIRGYIVKNGDPVRFYQSSNNFIHFGSGEDAATVNNYYTLQVNVDEVRIITATADDNGKITPAGEVAVPKGKNQTFKITPNEGYHIKDVLVDRESVGAVKEYTFTEVDKPHTIHATFARNSSGGGGGSHKPTVTIPDDVPTGLNGDDHYAYIVGYPDSTVRPQNGITRAEVATIFFRLLTDETRNANSTKSNSYSDVAAGAWYNHAVSTLSAMGIVKGDSHGKFNPNAPITRAEFAAIAARFDDKANTTAVDFSDIASHWAKNEISAAANNGWINGYTDGTFRPNNKITRAEAMTLVNRVLNRLPENSSDLLDSMIKWPDNSDVSAWYYLAVQEATNSHYYKTKENKFEKWSKLRETRDWTELEK
ncbi:S-layer homology domain-containing protein [Agathobaculum butyriciproducens]|uniref:S-layer homology domain-containing protein n=1 Tax=Agathobaculum butyriciproducens TaxID=1628085 RepID=UPI001D063A00|nr:S-layer homology domain-containing protein [Agathobaculum butyriciproducens]MCQ5047489.1 S-layer homology domain-containing protein [Agathobaculum butyriciproducens]